VIPLVHERRRWGGIATRSAASVDLGGQTRRRDAPAVGDGSDSHVQRDGLLLIVVLGSSGASSVGYVASAVLRRGSVDRINLESIVIATPGAISVAFVVVPAPIEGHHRVVGQARLLSRQDG